MSVATQASLEGMPEPSDLYRTVHDGRTVLTVGSRVLADYDSGDVDIATSSLGGLASICHLKRGRWRATVAI